MKKYQLTKKNAVDDPDSRSASSVAEYRESLETGEQLSTSEGYYVVGFFLSPPKEGEKLHILREDRNGVKIGGVFVSTQVRKLTKTDKGWTAETNNSVYEIEETD